MKILYVSTDRHAGELAAFALRGVAPDVAVGWSESLNDARRWTDEHPNLAVLIAEVDSDHADCESFIQHVRSAGVTAPVVVAARHPDSVPETLRGAADEVVPKDQAFLASLPSIVNRALKSRAIQPEAPVNETSSVVQSIAEPDDQRILPFAKVVPTRDVLEQRLSGALAAVERAAQAERQGQHASSGAGDSTSRQVLEQRLADATLALERAEHRHAVEIKDAAERLADQRKHADERSAQAALAIDALQTRLIDEAKAWQQAEQQAAADRRVAAEEAARRRAAIEAELIRETGNREVAEKALAAAEAGRAHADEQHASALAAISRRLADSEQRHASFEAKFAEETAKRLALAEELAGAEAALRRADEHHALEMTNAAAALQHAEQQAAVDRHLAVEQVAVAQASFDAALARESAVRETLAKQLADAETDRQRADDEHQSAMAALTARLTDYQAEVEARFVRDAAALAEIVASRQRLEKELGEKDEVRRLSEERLSHASKALDELQSKLTEAAEALQRAEQQAATDWHTAAEEAASAQTRFDAALTQETTERHALANQLVSAEAAREHADNEHQSAMAALMTRFKDYQAEAETRLARDTAALDVLRSDLARAAADLSLETTSRQTLERELQEQTSARTAVAAQLAERESRFEAELGQHVAQREAVARDLAEARTAADEAQRRFLEGVSAMRERAREHELQMEERATRERAEWEATLADRRQEIGRLHEQITSLREELAATTRQREMWRAEVALVPELRQQIDYLHTEHRRRFDDTPVSMCRCRPDGTLIEVTQTLARLLGYSGSNDLQAVDFAATVFDSPDELRWLIDRCVASRSVESIETTWTKKDGNRILVRLVAVATTPDGIDLAAQDITALRTLEERLRHSQRLEAVARYASEVAVTCENVLRDVKQDGQQWLNRIDSEPTRRHGKVLLDEVTRASGFLRKLAVYGDTETNLPMLVEVKQVLRRLKPVLEHVAGHDIELVLPKGSKPLHLDVETERVERILVNVAAYARERMPFGGRLMIETTVAVLNRTFAERYPTVRPGTHVLLTVTEVKGPARADWSAAFLNQTPTAPESVSPGVDLGVLQALVGDCGGHVWIAAEPSGDMVLKIHLPRRVLDDHEAAKRPGRWINRLASARQ